MATETETDTEKHRRPGVRRLSVALEGWYLDALVATLSAVMMFGVALDFRVHTEGVSFAEEGFLTPEHVFFYTAFLSIAAVIGASIARNRRRNGTWSSAVPSGYVLGLAGVLLFGVAGFGDYLWHSAFGFEEGIEGLTSPTHLMLATGATLFFSSPLRSAYKRGRSDSGFGIAPALISMSLALTIVVFFGSYINPIMRSTAHHQAQNALGIVSLFAFPAILVGGALVLMSRFDLPMGALTLTFAVPALMSAVIDDVYFLALPVLLAGILADLMNSRMLNDGDNRVLGYVPLIRLFGASVPATFALTYFGVVEYAWGVTWSIHIWAGTVYLAAMAGLLLTYAVVPRCGGDVSRLRQA
jgi:hypothetical protein